MKKIVSTIIAIVLLLSMAVSVSARIVDYEYVGKYTVFDTYTLGDINDDDSFNALDSYTLKSYITGGDVMINEQAADFDLDGKASSRDNLYIKTCLAGTSELSDYQTSNPVDKFTIAGNSIEDYEVVLNEDFVYNTDNATEADSILGTYVKRATGVDLNDVIGESNRTKPHMIRIDVIDPLGDREIPEDLGLEDYIYEVRDGDLYITGTLRGAMYAVYEILEEYLGIRFYLPSETAEYSARTADIPEGTYVLHRTEKEFRFTGMGISISSLTSFYYARRLNATYIYGGCSPRYGYQTGSLFDNAHSFLACYALGSGYRNMIKAEYTDEEIKSNLWACFRGEYAVNKDGHTWQPCASSFGENSDYQIMFEGLLLGQEMQERSGYDIKTMIELGILDVSFSICDNGNGCSCRLCKAKMTGGTVKRVSTDLMHEVTDKYSGEFYYDEAKKELTFKKESFNGTYLDLTNRAMEEIQDYYPGAQLWTIIYDFSIPETIRPAEGVSLMYCGQGCLQHVLGSGECGDNKTVLNTSNKINESSMKWWADTIHDEGGKIWFWSYAVNYTYTFLSTPCITEEYYNYHYLLVDCNFDGIFHEGCAIDSNFEYLKSYMSTIMNWNPQITYEEYCEEMKEFIYLYYGEGIEEIFQYIMLQEEAGDANGECFITNHDRPWDMYSWQYLSEHYEEMRALLDSAYEKANTAEQRERVLLLIFACDFMGLSSAYDRYWINGDEEHKNIFKERMTALYNYYLENDLFIAADDVYQLPDELDFNICPMNQFYNMGAFRTSLIPSFAK